MKSNYIKHILETMPISYSIVSNNNTQIIRMSINKVSDIKKQLEIISTVYKSTAEILKHIEVDYNIEYNQNDIIIIYEKI